MRARLATALVLGTTLALALATTVLAGGKVF